MKRFFIGIAVIGVFVLYSLGIRHKDPVLSAPSSLSHGNNSSGNTASNTTGSSGSSGSGGNATNNNYKDGSYTGSVADAYYGNVQVQAIIQGGKITDVQFLQYPNSHGTSVAINQQAMPMLRQEAIQAQSANVQIISGATFTSQAFIQSLQNALNQA